MTQLDLAELQRLASLTGMSHKTLGSLLDVDERSLMRWLSGERKPRHPAMLKKALQMIILEQRGIVTAKLIEETSR